MNDTKRDRADVTIRMVGSEMDPVLDLECSRSGARLAVQMVHAAKLGAIRAEFSVAVAEATVRASRTLTTVQDAARVLFDFASAGRLFLVKSLRQPAQSLFELGQFLKSECPAWQHPTARSPVIRAIGHFDDYVPWEMLPLFDLRLPDVVDDQLQLAEACRAFPGFCAQVENRGAQHDEHDAILRVQKKLPVRLFYDARLRGALRELGYFRGHGNFFHVEGPYPDNVDDPDAPTFAEQVGDPCVSLSGGRRDQPDQILHIACHGIPPNGAGARPGYQLADAQHNPVDVDLEDLFDELAKSWSTRRTDRGVKPLVFLNACSGTTADGTGLLSLIKPFYDNENRCVIGAAAQIPDHEAEYMSRWFYNYLLRGNTVGEALRLAKWRLLEDKGSPLGLLYTAHIFADLRIAPVPNIDLGS
jgi:hypothetical protein